MARFLVEYEVSGRLSEVIEADSLASAKKIADENMESDDWLPDLEVIVDSSATARELLRVCRNGKIIETSYLLPTDVTA